MVLIVVAISFDILWFFGKVPLAEIAVFVFILMIWAYGNLQGGKWEYPCKLGSFNLAIILLSNFYMTALVGNQEISALVNILASGILFPLLCLSISFSLYKYLKESVDHEIVLGILIGGTMGYMISVISVALLA